MAVLDGLLDVGDSASGGAVFVAETGERDVVQFLGLLLRLFHVVHLEDLARVDE